MTERKGLFAARHFVAAGKWHRFGPLQTRKFFYFWKTDFWLNAGNFLLFNLGFWQSFFYFRRLRPQLLFSKGGYVAAAPCLAARALKIPLILHDSDAVSGSAHVFFRNYAQLRLSGLPPRSSKKEPTLRHVGVPINPIFGQPLEDGKAEAILARYKLPANAKFVLVTGGGGGARNLNQGVLEVIDKLKPRQNVYFIIISGGLNYRETVEQAKQIKAAGRVRIVKFVDDMPDLMRACLGVVTRAGATILSEISLAGKAAIIVPNPLLPRAHQLHNARIYQRARAAWLVSDSGQNVSQRALKQALNEMISDTRKRRLYEERVGRLASPDAALKCLEAIEEVLSPLAEVAARSAADRRTPLKKHRRTQLLSIAQRKRRLERRRRILRNMLLAGKLLLLLAMGFGLLFKLFYINGVKVVVTEDSSLLADSQLESIEQEVSRSLAAHGILYRRFLPPAAELRQQVLDGRGYIKEVAIERDWIRSHLIVKLQPKHILGSFEAPNARTIVTTDGYAISGYEHLLEEGKYALTIKSPHPLEGRFERVLSPLDISFLNQMRDYLATQGWRLEEASLSTQPREITFKLHGYDFEVIALTARDPIEQGIALATTLDFFERTQMGEQSAEERERGVPATGTPVLLPQEYIDIRLIDRVIYK